MALLTHVPARAAVSSGFGYRIHPITGLRTLHAGQDRGWSGGTDIYAARSGVVVLAAYNGDYGNLIILDHGHVNGVAYRTRYAHNASFKVSVGDRVTGGQVIAVMGSTGSSTGIHNHFELWRAGRAVDPAPYLVDIDPAGDTGTPITPPSMTERDPMFRIVPANDGGIYVVGANGKRARIGQTYHVEILSRILNNENDDTMGTAELDIARGYLAQLEPDATSPATGLTAAEVQQIITDALAANPVTTATADQIVASVSGALADDFAQVNANIDDQPTTFTGTLS